MKIIKRISMAIAAISMAIILPLESLAAEPNYENIIIYPQESHLPHNGIDFFTESYTEENNAKASVPITTYEYSYTKGSANYGSWRNGVSGGSNVTDIVLSFNKSHDSSYNIGFTATVSGGYNNKAAIEAALGVTLGATSTYSLGAGISVTVPKGSHYLIKYRPVYYKYTVVETQYVEQYIEGYGLYKAKVGEQTCYVNVFSHWDFTVS